MIFSNFFSNDLFHFKHLVILVVCLTVLVLFTIYSVKNIKREIFHKILLVIGIVSESLKVITENLEPFKLLIIYSQSILAFSILLVPL